MVACLLHSFVSRDCTFPRRGGARAKSKLPCSYICYCLLSIGAPLCLQALALCAQLPEYTQEDFWKNGREIPPPPPHLPPPTDPPPAVRLLHYCLGRRRANYNTPNGLGHAPQLVQQASTLYVENVPNRAQNMRPIIRTAVPCGGRSVESSNFPYDPEPWPSVSMVLEASSLTRGATNNCTSIPLLVPRKGCVGCTAPPRWNL